MHGSLLYQDYHDDNNRNGEKASLFGDCHARDCTIYLSPKNTLLGAATLHVDHDFRILIDTRLSVVSNASHAHRSYTQ